MDDLLEFERLMKEYIKRSGRSQAATARLIGCHPSTLSKWIQGVNKISFEDLLKLCERIGTDGDERIELFRLAGYELTELRPTREGRVRIREMLLNKPDLETLEGSGFETDQIKQYIIDLTEPVYLRLKALDIYVKDGFRDETFFSSLARDPIPEVRQAMLRHIYRNQDNSSPILLQMEVLERLVNDEIIDVGVEAIKAIRYLVQEEILPLEALTAAKSHRYWLVRKIAIKYLVERQEPEMLDLLFEFRNTSYHVSQQLIRDFISRQRDSFDKERKKRAIDLLIALRNAKHASNSSRQKDEELLGDIRTSWGMV